MVVVSVLSINTIHICSIPVSLLLVGMAGVTDPDMFQVPIAALSSSTREFLSAHLNPLKVVPTDEGLLR
jgi:hypothetical protein